MNLMQSLQANGITILQAPVVSLGCADYESLAGNGLSFLEDYPNEQVYFVRFPDEMVTIHTPAGDFQCFGCYGEAGYFVIDQSGKVGLFFSRENDFDRAWVLVNRSLSLFAKCYCRFMAGVFALKADFDQEYQADEEVQAIAGYITSVDAEAMQEGAFWPHWLYVLEDGFFHLMHNLLHRTLSSNIAKVIKN